MRLQTMMIVSLFAAIVAVLSQIAVPLPFTPVPVTLQPLAVFLTGAVLGSRRGALALSVYVFMGAAGMPVFAQGEAGLPVLLGPKGGYLFGFILTAFIIGKLVEWMKQPSAWQMALAMIAGMAVYYLTGWAQLKIVLGLPWGKAFVAGVVPFLPLDLMKALFAAYLGASVRRRLAAAYSGWLS